MNSAWMGLENAPEGTLKNKIHGWVDISIIFFQWS